MCNNLVRDPAGIAPDPRRIKSHRAVIALGFGWLHRPGWLRGRWSSAQVQVTLHCRYPRQQ